MKSLFAVIFTLISVTIYTQFKGIVYPGAPYNQVETHFLFSSASDTIIFGTWRQLSNYPQALCGVNCYYWQSNGKILTCGGITAAGVKKKSCYWYNPASNSYEPADSLPLPRWSGKLVRVRDSLFLVGSIYNFDSADGKIYRYNPAGNRWVERDTMPSPKLHETAVCVFKDTLIICIGGSSGNFSGNNNLIRTYNPYKNRWKTHGTFPINTSSGHAECRSEDSTIVVVGGLGSVYINTIYRGKITFYNRQTDSINISWSEAGINDTTIFRTGVYRVGGGSAGDWMLFGPALRNSLTYNTIYNLGFGAGDTLYWRRLAPNIPDSAGNRPTLAVNYDKDSVRIYLFGGSVGDTTVLRSSYKFTYARPLPIGIRQVSANIPSEFKLFQNYPNPFNPVTVISYQLTNRSFVSLKIYDILGREISVLINRVLEPGTYEYEWDAGHLPSGIYFYRIGAGDFSETKKMILLK